jgi:hypothetical protein
MFPNYHLIEAAFNFLPKPCHLINCMDAAATGALIGIGGLIGIFICIKIDDILSKRRAKVPSDSTPLLVRTPLVRQHSKMNMILPK